MAHLRITKVSSPTEILKSDDYHTVVDCWVAARAFQQTLSYSDRDFKWLDKGVLIGRQDSSVPGTAYVGQNVEYRIEVTA